MCLSFHSVGTSASSHYTLHSIYSMSIDVLTSAFKSSAGMLSGPDAFLLFNSTIALQIFSPVDGPV